MTEDRTLEQRVMDMEAVMKEVLAAIDRLEQQFEQHRVTCPAAAA